MEEKAAVPCNGSKRHGHLSRKRRFVYALVLIVFNLLVFAVAYVGSVAWRCRQYSGKHSRWIGHAYQIDKRFGYFPKPEHIAYHALQHGEQVPVLFDENGFRVPVQREPTSSPAGYGKVLFLGGSFTHGYGVPAEKTFAYLSSRALSAEPLNAGGSGWGLAHMVLRAKREIPTMQPSWVVVQYSNWLVDRSMSFYGPTSWGKSPTPYVFRQDNEFYIHDPVFMSGNFAVPISEYAGKGSLAFIWHVGLPLFAYDDLHVVWTSLRRKLGLLPLPTTSRDDVVRFAYSEIYNLCKAHGAQMLIVKIPLEYSEHPYKDNMPELECSIVDSYPALVGRLTDPSAATWKKEYCFWRGSPPVLVDIHPNETAHKVISEVIVSAIRAKDAREETEPNKAIDSDEK
jgi:hypothetical protein